MADVQLLTDNHVRGPLIKAFRERGWDVVRAVDIFGEQNEDSDLFDWAAREAASFSPVTKGFTLSPTIG